MIDEKKLLMYLADLELAESPNNGEEESELYRNIEWFSKIVSTQPCVQLKLIEDIDEAIKATNMDDAYSVGMKNGMRYVKSLITGNDLEYDEVKTRTPIIVRTPGEIYNKAAINFLYCDDCGLDDICKDKSVSGCRKMWFNWLTGKGE